MKPFWHGLFFGTGSTPAKENRPGKVITPKKHNFSVADCKIYQDHIDKLVILIHSIGNLPGDPDKDTQMRIEVKLRERLQGAIKKYHDYLNSCQ